MSYTDHFKNSVVTCYSVVPKLKKEIETKEEVMNLCMNMILFVGDKHKTSSKLFDVFSGGSRFKYRDRKNLEKFLISKISKCTGTWFKYYQIDWNDYIELTECDDMDHRLIQYVCDMIYVMSDNYDLNKVFKLFPESYLEIVEYDEVTEGMECQFDVLFEN